MASKQSGQEKEKTKEKAKPRVRVVREQSEIVRRFKANPFVFIGTIVILVIVIVAFVLVPAIVPSTEAGMDLTFGSYNKVPIVYVQGNYFAQVRQSLAQQYQSSITESNSWYMEYQIWREAFESAVVRTAILEEMKRAGYTAPEDVVDKQVALLSDFQVNGVFSAAKYRAMDSTTRLALWRQMRDSITAERYLTDVTGLLTPSGETAFVSAMASPQRSFDLTSFPLSSYPDTELAAYVQANPRQFRTVHLSRITVSSSAKAAGDILASIQAGTTTFEDAAKTNSTDSYAESGGDMGIKMAYELVYELADEAYRE